MKKILSTLALLGVLGFNGLAWQKKKLLSLLMHLLLPKWHLLRPHLQKQPPLQNLPLC
nr:hypothetical protein [Methylobacillus glycogenes]